MIILSANPQVFRYLISTIQFPTISCHQTRKALHIQESQVHALIALLTSFIITTHSKTNTYPNLREDGELHVQISHFNSHKLLLSEHNTYNSSFSQIEAVISTSP